MFAYLASRDEAFLASGRGILGQVRPFHKLRGAIAFMSTNSLLTIGSLPPSAKLLFISSKVFLAKWDVRIGLPVVHTRATSCEHRMLKLSGQIRRSERQEK
jgi:hypothetical protein